MLCLGIETSCDETALALLRDGSIVDSVLASQADLHALFGGVVPELASREHYRFIAPLFDQLLERNSFKPGDIDIIAVTRGPGLLGSLLVGAAFAKSLALALSRPLLGINHLHAHLLAVGLEQKMVFPALGILVSGGHTHIYRILSPKEFILMGRTLDDAAGEAFDKTGHLLGLPYPAGRHIDELALMGTPGCFNLPHPFVDNDNLDFSFSGLKTAAARIIREELPINPSKNKVADFCASLNSAIAETLVIKMRRALAMSPDCNSIWLAGGVAANGMIREQMAALAHEAQLPFAVPSRKYCTDNAAMVAHAGYLLASNGGYHTLDLEMIPRGRKIPEDMLWH